MIVDLKNPNHVKGLQANLRASLGGTPGKEVMKFLDSFCGWYDFNEVGTNEILIKTGRRQIVATLKTIMDSTPEQVAYMAQEHEI